MLCCNKLVPDDGVGHRQSRRKVCWLRWMGKPIRPGEERPVSSLCVNTIVDRLVVMEDWAKCGDDR